MAICAQNMVVTIIICVWLWSSHGIALGKGLYRMKPTYEYKGNRVHNYIAVWNNFSAHWSYILEWTTFLEGVSCMFETQGSKCDLYDTIRQWRRRNSPQSPRLAAGVRECRVATYTCTLSKSDSKRVLHLILYSIDNYFECNIKQSNLICAVTNALKERSLIQHNVSYTCREDGSRKVVLRQTLPKLVSRNLNHLESALCKRLSYRSDHWRQRRKTLPCAKFNHHQ